MTITARVQAEDGHAANLIERPVALSATSSANISSFVWSGVVKILVTALHMSGPRMTVYSSHGLITGCDVG